MRLLERLGITRIVPAVMQFQMNRAARKAFSDMCNRTGDKPIEVLRKALAVYDRVTQDDVEEVQMRCGSKWRELELPGAADGGGVK